VIYPILTDSLNDHIITACNLAKAQHYPHRQWHMITLGHFGWPTPK